MSRINEGEERVKGYFVILKLLCWISVVIPFPEVMTN